MLLSVLLLTLGLFDLPLMQKQILKMLIVTEASRSMVFKAADLLDKSDNGNKISQKIFSSKIFFLRRVQKKTNFLGGGRKFFYAQFWTPSKIARKKNFNPPPKKIFFGPPQKKILEKKIF